MNYSIKNSRTHQFNCNTIEIGERSDNNRLSLGYRFHFIAKFGVTAPFDNFHPDFTRQFVEFVYEWIKDLAVDGVEIISVHDCLIMSTHVEPMIRLDQNMSNLYLMFKLARA